MRKTILRAAAKPIQSSFRSTSTNTSTRHLSTSIRHLRPRALQAPLFYAQRLCQQRLYSTEPTSAHDADVNGKSNPSEAETATAAASGAEDGVKRELETARKEIIELKDKYLRSVADFRNLQDRTKRELSSARDFAISKFARDLLDSIDNLDRALGTVPEAVVKASKISSEADGKDKGEGGEKVAEEINKDLLNLYDGLKMTERILLGTLAKHGLERFDPAENGDRFDPNRHDASFMAPVTEREDGSVFTTVQKGFLLNGRVVRAAKVGVVKNS